MWKHIKNFFNNQRQQPFEVMLGFFFVNIGIVGLYNLYIGKLPLTPTFLGMRTSITFHIFFIVSGLGMFFGIGFNRINIQAFGLITMTTALVVRIIMVVSIIGFKSLNINAYLLSTLFIFSCIIKLVNIIKTSKLPKVVLNIE